MFSFLHNHSSGSNSDGSTGAEYLDTASGGGASAGGSAGIPASSSGSRTRRSGLLTVTDRPPGTFLMLFTLM